MKVSVIIPVYNVEQYIEECVTSVLRQTLTDIEVICVDDGSTDRSYELLAQMQRRDDRLHVLRQSNEYAGAARNKGIEAATGDYLIFLDSDDANFFHENCLKILNNRI